MCIICCRVVGRWLVRHATIGTGAHMLHRASRDQGQGRVEIFSAHNSGQLVEVGRRFADIARTVAGGTAPCSPLNTTVSANRDSRWPAAPWRTTAWCAPAMTAMSTTSC